MNVNVELMMQYITYFLMAIGVLAFLVSAIVQVIKELPGLQRVPTSVVVLAVSLILCPLAVVIVCQYLKIVVTVYYIIAAIIVAFIVYLIATGGWERVSAIWQRTRYKDK